jgi:hypothetical protein
MKFTIDEDGDYRPVLNGGLVPCELGWIGGEYGGLGEALPTIVNEDLDALLEWVSVILRFQDDPEGLLKYIKANLKEE